MFAHKASLEQANAVGQKQLQNKPNKHYFSIR